MSSEKNFNFQRYIYTDHAFVRMFERNISPEAAEDVIEYGERIEERPAAKPLPKCLLFKFVTLRALHVSIGINQPENCCNIITLYEPTLDKFESDFKTRKP